MIPGLREGTFAGDRFSVGALMPFFIMFPACAATLYLAMSDPGPASFPLFGAPAIFGFFIAYWGFYLLLLPEVEFRETFFTLPDFRDPLPSFELPRPSRRVHLDYSQIEAVVNSRKGLRVLTRGGQAYRIPNVFFTKSSSAILDRFEARSAQAGFRIQR